MITVRNQNHQHHTSRFPFTSSQWQELEHQALVYKYMISGMPIPPYLLFSIKTSLMDPPSKLIQFPHQPFGWDYFHMGYGRKIDPEPGRCRRTDGKKWRCSKEAFGDSKYCERHMHRGRNRSRKPVESRSVPSQKDLISCSSGTISASFGDSWLLEPLAVNNSSSSLADYQNDHSYLQLHNSPKTQMQDQNQGCCYDQKIDGKEVHKVMHRFFDESPHSDNENHNKDKDSSTSQLSISIPSSGHDFFLTPNDK